MIQFFGPLTCDLQNVTDCIGSCFGLGRLVAAYSELVVSGTMLEPVQELPFKILDDLAYWLCRWRQVIGERELLRNTVRTCIMQKKVSFAFFKQWYWDCFDEDVQVCPHVCLPALKHTSFNVLIPLQKELLGIVQNRGVSPKGNMGKPETAETKIPQGGPLVWGSLPVHPA